MDCKVCRSEDTNYFVTKKDTKKYWRCNTCFAVFTDPSHYVDLEEEKASSYIISTLRDIVKNKSAKSMKFKDGSMKIDMTTANMMLQVLDKINPMNKKKVMNILDKGGKGDFMKVHNVVMKALG